MVILFGCNLADSAIKEPFVGAESDGRVGYSRALAGWASFLSVGWLRLGKNRVSRHPLRATFCVSGLGSSSGFPDFALCFLTHFSWEFQLELNTVNSWVPFVSLCLGNLRWSILDLIFREKTKLERKNCLLSFPIKLLLGILKILPFYNTLDCEATLLELA